MQKCSCYGCGNQRKHEGPTMQERRSQEGWGGGNLEGFGG
jgi:hypothetical protein